MPILGLAYLGPAVHGCSACGRLPRKLTLLIGGVCITGKAVRPSLPFGCRHDYLQSPPAGVCSSWAYCLWHATWELNLLIGRGVHMQVQVPLLPRLLHQGVDQGEDQRLLLLLQPQEVRHSLKTTCVMI